MNLDNLGSTLFVRVVDCARRDGAGGWVLTLDEPHDDEATKKAFLTELLRAYLTPAEVHLRDRELDHAIQDTSTGPLDAGRSP